MKTWLIRSLIALALLSIFNFQLSTTHAQGTTAFTYQGQLRDGGTNANGTYTMIFKLYDAVTSGNQIGSAITNSPTLGNGLFSVNLDFGAGAFNGSTRWLDITISNGVAQTLSPRVQVLPTPYALYAAVAGSVSNAVNVSAGTVTNLKVVYGIVNTDGSVGVNGVGTGGFSASMTSNGHYHITFSPPFSGPEIVTLGNLADPSGDDPRTDAYVQLDVTAGYSASGFYVRSTLPTFTGSNIAFTHTNLVPFTFTAIGPQ